MELLVENAYVYSFRKDRISMRRGSVYAPIGKNRCEFMVKNKIYSYLIAKEPNVIFTNNLWMPIQNDFLALSLFMENEKSQIVGYQKKIEKCIKRFKFFEKLRNKIKENLL